MKQIKVQTLYGHELDSDIGEEGVTIDQFIATYNKAVETTKSQYDCVDDTFLIMNERYGYDGGRDMLLKFQRYETDEEYAWRLEAEKEYEKVQKKHAESAEKKELAQLKKLARKYGKKLV